MSVLVDTLRLGDLGSNQDAVSEHELRSNIPEASLIWELTPHSAHQWLSGKCCPLKSAVNVVNKIVAHIDCITNGLLDSTSLQPGFPVQDIEWKIDRLRMGAEERIPHSDLIEHDKEILSRGPIKAWYVRASKWVPCIAQLHNH